MLSRLLPLVLFLISFSAFSSVYTVKRFHGDVFVNKVKVSKKNQDIMRVKAGDSITAVGKKSFIQVRSDLGSVFLVRDGKALVQKITKKETGINLIKGKFFHYFNKAKKREFTVITKNAVMGVRGTKYMVEATDDKTYLCVCDGKVAIQKKGETKEYIVGKDFDMDIVNNEKVKEPREASSMMRMMTYGEFEKMGFPVQ